MFFQLCWVSLERETEACFQRHLLLEAEKPFTLASEETEQFR